MSSELAASPTRRRSTRRLRIPPSSKRILYIADPDQGELMVTLLHLERPGLIVERMGRKDVNSEDRVLKVAYGRYDVIVLPLTLPHFNSVRIAEAVHRGNIRTRLLLHSATEAFPNDLQPLFDYFIRRPAGLEKLSWRHSTRPATNFTRLELQGSTVERN